MREDFLRNEYPKILQRHKLKLSCARCTTVYADFAIAVSLTGQVEIERVQVAKACGLPMNKKLMKDFSSYVLRYPYKPGLYGTTVLLRLGTGLKC